LELHHPPVAVRFAVHELWLFLQPPVHLDDLTGERREQLGYGFHSLDRSEDVVLLEFRSERRELEVDDVAELTLRVVRDPDRHDLGVFREPYILVVFRVEKILGNLSHARCAVRGMGYAVCATLKRKAPTPNPKP